MGALDFTCDGNPLDGTQLGHHTLFLKGSVSCIDVCGVGGSGGRQAKEEAAIEDQVRIVSGLWWWTVAELRTYFEGRVGRTCM